jgi:uncharacterized repeat protein (TIGR03803 family)
VFAVNTDGSVFTNLHNFTALSDRSSSGANEDGASPTASLILSGTTLYGTASGGGTGGNGTLFKLDRDGTTFTALHNFSVLSGGDPFFGINSDGRNPSGLILSRNTLYGTARGGGTSGRGTVFAVNIDGTGFCNLHSFTTPSPCCPSDNSDGLFPNCLVLSGDSLYGTANEGGSSSWGTLFSISLPASVPQLTMIPSGSNVVLMWPENATGFTLQSTTNLSSPAWVTNFPAPIVVNGQNTVTNPISGTQQFFRLSE